MRERASLIIMISIVISLMVARLISYLFLLVIKYFAHGELYFKWSKLLREITIGCTGRGHYFFGIFFRYFCVKGF